MHLSTTIKKLQFCIPSLIALFLCIQTYAQDIDLTKKITIVYKDAPLENVLNDIESKTGVKFSYSTQIIDPKQNVTVVGRKKRTDDILRLLFADLNIDYVMVEKQIVLKKKYTLHNEIPNKKEKRELFTVSGDVRNESDGEALIGAGISILNTQKGTSANEYGFYSLSLPKGHYVLRYSYIGHEDKDIEIELDADKSISTLLKTNDTEIEIIIVTENQNAGALEQNNLKSVKINERQLTGNLGFAGEANVVNTIQNIPGINSCGEGSVLFYVRGGGKDQNLITIDDAPVYNPSHLFGFFSAIAPDAVNDIKVYKNNFPMKYGGRLSSLVDIRTKDGNLQKWGFSIILSPFTGSWSVDGPLKKERSSLFFTLRNAHLNAYLKNTNNAVDFYDLHLKLNTKIAKKSRLFFSFYSGKDELKTGLSGFGSGGLSWQNNAMSLRWNKLYSDKLFSNMTLHTAKYDYFLHYSIENNQYWNSFIGNLSFKNDFSYFKNPNNQFDFGVNLNVYFFNPGNLNNDYFGRTVYASNATEYILYGGHDIRLFDKLDLAYGLRLISWNNHGPSVVFKYDEEFRVSDTLSIAQGSFNQFLNAEPRISLTYVPFKKMSIKIAYDRNIQHLQLLSNSISPFTTLDVWMPSGINIKPEKVHQFTVGFYKMFWETECSVEAYYKSFQNLIDYKEHANMLLNPYIEGELRFGTGRSYGLECTVQKKKGNFNFMAAYTYSRVFHKVAALNNGTEYPARYDKPHTFTITANYEPGIRWVLNAAWFYSSGMRFSSPTGFYAYKGYSIPIYGEKNNDRLPDYHRLDVSLTLRANIKESARFRHEFTFSVYNLYGRNNVIAVNFNKIETDVGSYVVPIDFISENEAIVSSKYISVFMPSLTYALKFR